MKSKQEGVIRNENPIFCRKVINKDLGDGRVAEELNCSHSNDKKKV